MSGPFGGDAERTGRRAAPNPPFDSGVIAQLGERLNGIQEVGGSIPPGSTKYLPVSDLLLTSIAALLILGARPFARPPSSRARRRRSGGLTRLFRFAEPTRRGLKASSSSGAASLAQATKPSGRTSTALRPSRSLASPAT